MTKQNMRVIVASEHPGVQGFLKGVVAQEGGAVTIGQAKNTVEALALARNLEPDVALIDCDLPHFIGLDTIPLSRMGGLDAARTISQEIPNIRVVLLNNLGTEVLAGGDSSPDIAATFSVEAMGIDNSFALQALYDKVVQPNALVFANVEAKPRASRRWNISSLSGADVMFGSLSILGGLSLIATLVLVDAWVILAYPAAAAIGVGAGLLWKKSNYKSPDRESRDSLSLSSFGNIN